MSLLILFNQGGAVTPTTTLAPTTLNVTYGPIDSISAIHASLTVIAGSAGGGPA